MNAPSWQTDAAPSQQTASFNNQISQAPANQQSSQPYATVYSPKSTKQDFPTIMTRGRVVEGRLDLELEKQGSILIGGRDEKDVI